MLTSKVLELGFRYLQTNDMVERAQPYLKEGRIKSREMVNLSELDDTSIVFVTRSPAHHLITIHMLIGPRLPACAVPLPDGRSSRHCLAREPGSFSNDQS